MERPDVVVLGVGGMGSAACAHLARRGAKVLGLERFAVAHDRGSSHGETRLIRQAYMEGEGYVPLALRAYELWDELGDRAGRALLHRTGLLYLGPAASPALASVEEAARLHRLRVEALDAAAVTRRFPDFRVPEGGRGVFEVEGGYLDVEACVAAHVAWARDAGAEVREGAVVAGWDAAGDGVRVRWTEGGREHSVDAGALVLTAGAWSGPLLADLGLPLEVRRVPLLWFRTRREGAHGEGAPCFFMDLPHGEFYGFRDRAPHGVKVAEHLPREPVEDPGALDRELHAADVVPVAQAVEAALPELIPEPTHHAVCMYTMTPDTHFVIDRHPAHPRVVLAAGFSGHGFKFAAVVGEVLADLALEGATRHPIGFLGLGRFSGT